MRYRRNVRLDPSQIEDRRGRGGMRGLPGGGLTIGGGGLSLAGLVIYLPAGKPRATPSRTGSEPFRKLADGALRMSG